MSQSCLIPSPVFGAIAGYPHYQLRSFSPAELDAEMTGLTGPYVISARISGVDATTARLLSARGFAKICTQGLLVARAEDRPAEDIILPAPAGEAAIPDLDAHAENFSLCEFSFDAHIDDRESMLLSRRYIGNALARPGARIFRHASGIALAHEEWGEKAVLDCLSVLEKRRGTGATLVRSVLCWAGRRGLRWVEAVTECENTFAMLFYQRCGFHLAASFATYYRFSTAETH